MSHYKERELSKNIRRGKIPKTAGKHLLRRWIELLQEAMKTANFTNACFDPFTKGHPLTEEIKEKTRLYRESWVTPPMQQILWEMQAILDGKTPEDMQEYR